MAKLTNGYNIVIQQKVGSTSKPIYPFTRSANVINTDGDSMDTVISGILAKNFVPDYTGEDVSSLRFLRNDNTWATIQSASTAQAGVVALSSDLTSDSETVAATAAAAKALKDAIDTLNASVDTSGSVLASIKANAKDATYSTDGQGVVTTIEAAIKNAEAAAKTAGVVNVVKQEIAESGYAATYYVTQADAQVGVKINIPKDYLVKSCSVKICDEDNKPVEGYKVGDKYIDFVVNSVDGSGNESHIYLLVNELVDVYTGKTVDNGVSVAIDEHNEVSASISGKAIARVNIDDNFEADITALEGTHAKEESGALKSVSAQITAEAASATYSTSTIGATLDSILDANSGILATAKKYTDDKIAALDATVNQTAGDDAIAATITEVDGVVTAISVSQTAATASANGYATKEQIAKLNNCEEISVSSATPTFASGNGIWFQIVSEDN